nr:6-hydroxymethylpterin diphosphokinase MptE-like protein [Leptospira brenneri]
MPVVLGIGALHIVRSYLESPNHHQIIVFWEPIQEVYELEEFQTEIQILKEGSISKEFRFFFITGPTPNWLELKEKIKNLPNASGSSFPSKWSLYTTPSYERIFPELIQNCKNHFQSELSASGVNQNTIQHFQKVWTHNYLKNRMNLASSKTNIEWFQSFKKSKTSVLFIGASPGLELDLIKIKEERKHFLIFASDTSIGYLLPNGIIPDYIVSFDSGRGTTYHFLVDLPKDIPIITWLGGSAHLFELPNPKILVNTGHPLDQILEHQFMTTSGKEWPHYSNPSLNLFGMVLAITDKMEQRDFFVSGVSYLAERGKSHCKGTGYERYYLPETNRKKSLELTTKRLYSGERKGKNQTAWIQINPQGSPSNIQFLSEIKEKPFSFTKGREHSLQSFQGFPPSLAELAKWADQDHSGIIHRKTLNTWLRFSLS